MTQPWAWAIVAGIRPILSRYWVGGTSFVGPVLIHSARNRVDRDGSKWLLEHGYLPENLSYGMIVGRVQLACCVSTELIHRVLGAAYRAWIERNDPRGLAPGVH